MVDRCPACHAPHTLCFCAELPRIPSRIRVLIVRHPDELRKVSNTGAIAARVIGATLADYGASPLADLGPTPHLLFADGPDRPEWPIPSTLVVLDGTWRQARRMRIRIGAGMPVLTLPPDGRPAVLRMRERRLPGSLSTIEAIAGALDRLGEPEPAAALRDVSDRMNALWMQLRRRGPKNGPLPADV